MRCFRHIRRSREAYARSRIRVVSRQVAHCRILDDVVSVLRTGGTKSSDTCRLGHASGCCRWLTRQRPRSLNDSNNRYRREHCSDNGFARALTIVAVYNREVALGSGLWQLGRCRRLFRRKACRMAHNADVGRWERRPILGRLPWWRLNLLIPKSHVYASLGFKLGDTLKRMFLTAFCRSSPPLTSHSAAPGEYPMSRLASQGVS